MGAGARTSWTCLLGPALMLVLAGCGATSVRAPVEDRDSVHSTATDGGYSVRQGDTLLGIAFRHGLDYRKVAAWNGLVPPYRIFPGQRLRLYGPSGDPPAVPEHGARADDPLGPRRRPAR